MSRVWVSRTYLCALILFSGFFSFTARALEELPREYLKGTKDEINEQFLKIFESRPLTENERARLLSLWNASLMANHQNDAHLEPNESVQDDHYQRIERVITDVDFLLTEASTSDSQGILQTLPLLISTLDEPRLYPILFDLNDHFRTLILAERKNPKYQKESDANALNAIVILLTVVAEYDQHQHFQLAFENVDLLGEDFLSNYLGNYISEHSEEAYVLLAMTKDIRNTKLRSGILNAGAERLTGQELFRWMFSGLQDPDQEIRVRVAANLYRFKTMEFDPHSRSFQIIFLRASECFMKRFESGKNFYEYGTEVFSWTYALQSLSPENFQKQEAEYLDFLKTWQNLPQRIREVLARNPRFASSAYAIWLSSDQENFDLWKGVSLPDDAPICLAIALRQKFGGSTDPFNAISFYTFMQMLEKLKARSRLISQLNSQLNARSQGFLNLLSQNPGLEQKYLDEADSILKDWNSDDWPVRNAADLHAAEIYPNYNIGKTKLALALWSRGKLLKSKNELSEEVEGRLNVFLGKIRISHLEILSLTHQWQPISLSKH